MSTFSKTGIFVLILGLILVVGFYHKALIQKFHVHTLTSEGLDERILPHRINSIDKLYRILNDDIRSFEVDLIFKTAGHYGFFEVGHDEHDATGIHFDLFLNILRNYEIKKLWLDVKNVNEHNIRAIVNELDRLDSVYNLRDISIIESSSPANSLRMLSSRGFHTSYYLSTEKILRLLHEKSDMALNREAHRIHEQILHQSMSAVSFDLKLYAFVKNYLEPVIPDHIVYHAWNSVRLYDLSSIQALKSSDYYSDSRLKTILVRYHHRNILNNKFQIKLVTALLSHD